MADDYPETLRAFEARFSTEGACREYLEALRWPRGWSCPECQGRERWRTRRSLWMCTSCGHQDSVTAGTLFQGARSLRLWFRAAWWVTSQKTGASALGLQKVLGLGSYRTAWAWLHKFRRAMVRPERDRLAGEVEVDESFVGGHEPGGGRRHIGKKALVAIAVELRGGRVGRARMRRVRDSTPESLLPFVRDAVEQGSTVITDGLPSYLALPDLGYRHDRRVVRGSGETAYALLPRVHLVASLMKRWLLGTHQGAVSRENLDYYLDEFTFRFNRRASKHRGKLFFRLLEQAVRVGPMTSASLVKKRRAPT